LLSIVVFSRNINFNNFAFFPILTIEKFKSKTMASYKKIPLKPFPNGWYMVAHSNEVKNGEIITRRFAGKDVLLFRTESGKLVYYRALLSTHGWPFWSWWKSRR
jgi:hypothetical protein